MLKISVFSIIVIFLFDVLWERGRVLFCANRKERKESQAFSLTEVRKRFLGAIGSPTGVFA